MTSDERRIELLRLTKPAASMPDMDQWLAMAKQLEAWVASVAGQSSPEAPRNADPIESPKVRTQRKAPPASE